MQGFKDFFTSLNNMQSPGLVFPGLINNFYNCMIVEKLSYTTSNDTSMKKYFMSLPFR